MEESKKLTTETNSLISSAESESEVSPSLSFLLDNGYMHQKDHLIEGIKCFMSLSKMLKMKERENCILRNQIEALKISHEIANKGNKNHQYLEKHKLLEAVIEELKERLEIHLQRHETMQARLEELEFQKMHMETNSARMERIIQNLKSSFEFSKLKETNGKDSEVKGSEIGPPGRLKVPEDPQSSLENIDLVGRNVQLQVKNAKNMVHTEIKSSVDVKTLPSVMIDTSTHGAVTADSPIPSSSNSNTNSTDDNHPVEMEIKKLVEIMDNQSQNRRISTLPATLQFEPPVIYQSSETFVRITDILKTILAGRKVPYRSIQGFWDYLIHQANIVEKVIKEKTNEIRRLAGEELNRMEKEHANEKKTIVEELRHAEELAQERLFLQTELTNKQQSALNEKDHTINLLDRENSNLLHEISQYKVALAASLQASRSKQAAEMAPKICQPSVVQCDHEDYRQQLEDLKISSKKTEKALKHKLILAEKKLDLEKQKHHLKMASLPDSRSDTNQEAAPLKVDKKPDAWYKPRTYAYANAGRGEVNSEADKEDESFNSRKEPEDKNWLISHFLKNDSIDS